MTGYTPMLRMVFTLIFLLLPTLPAQAEKLGINWSALSPGQYQKLRTSEGAQLINQYIGPRDGLFLFEVFYGRHPSDIPNERVYLDKDGQFVKSVFVSGATKVFEPNDCSRTLGACTFVLHMDDGNSYAYSQITKRTAKGLKFTRRDATGKIVMRATLELRPSGLVRNLAIRTPMARTGHIREVKLIK